MGLHLSNGGLVQSGGKLTATPQCRQNVYDVRIITHDINASKIRISGEAGGVVTIKRVYTKAVLLEKKAYTCILCVVNSISYVIRHVSRNGRHFCDPADSMYSVRVLNDGDIRTNSTVTTRI